MTKKAKAPATPAVDAQALATPASLAGLVQTATVAEAKAAKRAGPVVVYTMGEKPYRVTAPHNVERWEAICEALEAGGGQADSAELRPLSGPTPDTMLGYLVRGGHLALVEAE